VNRLVRELYDPESKYMKAVTRDIMEFYEMTLDADEIAMEQTAINRRIREAKEEYLRDRFGIQKN